MAGMAYLNLISLPPGMNREQGAEFVADSGVCDARTVWTRLGHACPLILGWFEFEAARSASSTIRAAGGDAFVCTLEEIQALGATLRLKRLSRVDEQSWRAELWRGEPIEFTTDSIWLLVRASIGRSTAGLGGASNVETAMPRAGLLAADILLDTPVTLAGVINMGMTAKAPEPTRHRSERLDLHLADHAILQIDGGKFDFSVLQSLKGSSDKANVDQVFRLMGQASVESIKDDFFRLWRPPLNLSRFRLPTMLINNEDPAFAFYSRWAALMYRSMTRA